MTDQLADWVTSLGANSASTTPPTPLSFAQWLEAAAGRPEWMLWGKAMPAGPSPAHPLLCHMLDVSAVAAMLLTSVLPRALRLRLLAIDRDELRALRTLLFVIALHDIGKATPAFQAKATWARELLPERGFDLDAYRSARHHGSIGLFFLKAGLRDLGADSHVALRLARAVCAHHGEFPADRNLDAPGRRERGQRPQWQVARDAILQSLAAFFGVEALSSLGAIDHALGPLLAGLTSVADWIGSMDGIFRYEPPQDSLETYWPAALARADEALQLAGMRAPHRPSHPSFKKLFPDFTPWPLHRIGDEIAARLKEPALVISEAPMGEGKTEHALVLAEAAAANLGQTGLFIGLPTQATANQMFGRLEGFLRRTRAEPATLVLAHGEASLVERFQRISLLERFRSVKLAGVYDDEGGVKAGAVRAEAWFLSKKRALLAENAVGTIDQALLSVMRVGHAFVRIYGLAGKVVVLDEVHAYDTYTSALLDRLIEWLAAAGTTVVLLSATLPSRRRDDLVRAYRKGAGLPDVPMKPVPYPRVTITSGSAAEAHHFKPRAKPTDVKLECVAKGAAELADEAVEAARRGACVGWICNTVARAQEAARHVGTRAPNKLVIHSRLFPDDRGRREALLDRWLGPQDAHRERPAGCVVIGTQVLEQSLDVDFDLLVTELAPIDLLLQRAGRLWRHQRSNRSGTVAEPRVIVVCPQGPWSAAKRDGVAEVYDELWVRRTLRELEGRKALTLPDDIEPLVEAVYASTLSEAESALERPLWNQLGKVAAFRSEAERRMLPHPYMEDDPFANFKVYLEDDEDPALHVHLQAVTRLGPPSVELVCVERRDGRVFVAEGDASPLDLRVSPDRQLVERLLRRSISVNKPDLVHTIAKCTDAAPPTWEKVPLLRYRRLVAFEGGRCRVGDVGLRLDPELGLCFEAPR